MQISERYGLVYVISKLGFVFVYDLESATAVYRNRISTDPVFLACTSEATGGIFCVNRYRRTYRVGVLKDATLYASKPDVVIYTRGLCPRLTRVPGAAG